MKPKHILTLFLATLALSLNAADSTNRVRFPLSGFSIMPLEAHPGDKTCQALAMFLPTTTTFAPNVNVQIQPYTNSIDEYMTLTLSQFKEVGVKLIAQKKAGNSAVVFEYSGELRGQALHWYARAEKGAGHVYLATATAPEEDWPKAATRLKTCVDSLCYERP